MFRIFLLTIKPRPWNKSSEWRKQECIKNHCHYEERSDEVIHSHTRIFWIATKIFCHYEERSDEVIHSHTCIFWIATKIFDFLAMTSVCVMLKLFCSVILKKLKKIKLWNGLDFVFFRLFLNKYYFWHFIRYQVIPSPVEQCACFTNLQESFLLSLF